MSFSSLPRHFCSGGCKLNSPAQLKNACGALCEKLGADWRHERWGVKGERGRRFIILLLRRVLPQCIGWRRFGGSRFDADGSLASFERALVTSPELVVEAAVVDFFLLLTPTAAFILLYFMPRRICWKRVLLLSLLPNLEERGLSFDCVHLHWSCAGMNVATVVLYSSTIPEWAKYSSVRTNISCITALYYITCRYIRNSKCLTILCTCDCILNIFISFQSPLPVHRLNFLPSIDSELRCALKYKCFSLLSLSWSGFLWILPSSRFLMLVSCIVHAFCLDNY